VRTNNLGFRCEREFVEGKAPGVRRALLFGDSFTAGDGVSNRHRYGDLLEERIDDLEVFNFGLPGSGTDQQYLAYRQFARGLSSDLIIIAVLVENIRRVVSEYRVFSNARGEPVCFAKPYYRLKEGTLILENVPPREAPVPLSTIRGSKRRRVDMGGRFAVVRGVLRRFGLKELAQRLSHYQPVPEYNSRNSMAWRLLSEILKTWITDARVPVLLMPIPLYQHVEGSADPSAYLARFKELAAQSGAVLHDPLRDFCRVSLEERRKFRFETDPHLTPLGHEAIANSLQHAVGSLLGQR
jgi:carbamoyltransferase